MTTTTNIPTRPAGALALGLCLLAPLTLATLSGCQGERTDDPPRQFLPDMDDSPKFKPQTEAEFFQDGRAMRPRVRGTVAYGESAGSAPMDRARHARLDAAVFEGVDAGVAPKAPAEGQPPEPTYVATIPAGAVAMFASWMEERNEAVPAGEAERAAAVVGRMVERGRERFNIYCSACHGFKAEGGDPTAFAGGVVGRRWTYPVPSLQDAKYRDRSQKTGRDGYLFHVIRNGVPDANPDNPPKMPSYADKVNERDAWAIVAYVRALQASWQDPGAASAPATPPSAAPGGPGTTGGAGMGTPGAGGNR